MNWRILLACGMAIPVMYIFMYILGGALRPGYNHISDSVSELLSPGAPNRSLITIIDLAYGLLHILFGIGVLQFIWGSEHNALMGSIGAWMIVGAGVAIVGLYTFISFGAMILLGGAGAAMAGTRLMGLGERISALVIHQWLFTFALKLLSAKCRIKALEKKCENQQNSPCRHHYRFSRGLGWPGFTRPT